VREIFRYPKSDNLLVTLHRRRSVLQFSRAGEKKPFDPAEGLAS